MLRCVIPLLALHFVLQYQKCIYLSRRSLERIFHSEPAPHKEFLYQCKTLARNQRFRAFIRVYVLPSPDDARLPAPIRRQETATSFHLQAVLSATVAIPSGPVLELPAGSHKMERDDQFFLSISLSPHASLTAARASPNNSSGPRSMNDSTVAGSPSTSSPRISSTPHKT